LSERATLPLLHNASFPADVYHNLLIRNLQLHKHEEVHFHG
jgi:hypothetical protein